MKFPMDWLFGRLALGIKLGTVGVRGKLVLLLRTFYGEDGVISVVILSCRKREVKGGIIAIPLS
jgi:hypothetical protein